MANTDAPFGLRPVRSILGCNYGQANEYPIASGYATSLFIGDPVKAVAGGTIERAAAGDVILGVFMGCRYSSDNQNVTAADEKKYWPASTVASDAYAYVVDDPNTIFEVQATTAAAADLGANADIVVGTGNTRTGVSGSELDGSTIAATAAQLRILRKVPRDANDFGSNVKLEVLINEHFYKQTAGI